MLIKAVAKACSSCGVVKQPSEFQKRAASKDGLMASCRECAKARDKARYPAEKSVRLDRQKDYIQTDAGRAAHDRAVAKWRKSNKKKLRAHNLVQKAIARGKLIAKDACEECGSGNFVQGHHDDYGKPLQVRWLCDACHKAWHKTNDAIGA